MNDIQEVINEIIEIIKKYDLSFSLAKEILFATSRVIEDKKISF